MNYFELFEIPVSPKVNQNTLTKKYFALQRQHHPDFYSNATDAEKEEIMETSAAINKAYTTFKDDQKTLEYFLILKGQIDENEKYSLPDLFLMEMMDFNEELLEMTKEEAIKKIGVYDQEFYSIIKDDIENYNEQNSNESLPKMKEYYYKKKYLNRILDRLQD